jgi:hypothetical protein|nr:hypothetical protein [Kofleriaceae bacterium]
MTVVAELDEVTLDLEVDGDEVRRTIGRRVWERGAWATIAIAYEQRPRDDAAPWSRKLALLRMQRVRGAWKKHASLTLAGDDARELAAAITTWLAS